MYGFCLSSSWQLLQEEIFDETDVIVEEEQRFVAVVGSLPPRLRAIMNHSCAGLPFMPRIGRLCELDLLGIPFYKDGTKKVPFKELLQQKLDATPAIDGNASIVAEIIVNCKLFCYYLTCCTFSNFELVYFCK